MCTLYQGKLYGPAHLHYKDKHDKMLSFKGIGHFTDGSLHLGPFTCVDGEGWGRSYSHMLNGRPADGHFQTMFFTHGYSRYVESLKTNTNVVGC
jgi:hypothetical protein